MQQPHVDKDLVLIGGGHAHVHVLKSFASDPMPGLRVTLVARDVETPYSGMLPGLIAGHYTHAQSHIDLQPLSRQFGFRLVRAAALGLDRGGRRVLLSDRPPLPYDIVSIDIGSTPRLEGVPGAERHAIPIKPIDALSARWSAVLDRFTRAPVPSRFVTVGGGAAGIEVTLAMQHRLAQVAHAAGLAPGALSFTVLTRSEILPGHAPSVRARMRGALARHGIGLREGFDVVDVGDDRVRGAGGEVPYDELIWVTQASGARWLVETGLELDDAGFIRVDDTLRAVNDPLVFAAGDVASSDVYPRPKAGVFAVRQGPPLAHNLRLALQGQEPRTFVPQTNFLSLISTGDKYAIASRGRWSAEGAVLWRLKDWIDRRWMRMYQAPRPMPMRDVSASGASSGAAPASPDLMRCGGCAAKVGASALERTLARLSPRKAESVEAGLDAPDDAAILKPPPPGMLTLQTVDFFRAFIDDPYVFGRIAANHALGDIYAMGGTPTTALATAVVPFAGERQMEEELFQMLRGGLDVLDAAGAALVGGHSGEGAELALGFAITGVVDPARILRKGGAQPGDALILTKPLGTGVLFAADMLGKARGRWISAALVTMQQPARQAMDCLMACGARAATDVTGFGLAGHLAEMMRAAKTDAEIVVPSLPVLDGARELFAAGVHSSLAPENMRVGRLISTADGIGDHALYPLLFDPQTAGGLLASVPEAHAHRCVSLLQQAGYAQAAIVGRVVAAAGATSGLIRAS